MDLEIELIASSNSNKHQTDLVIGLMLIIVIVNFGSKRSGSKKQQEVEHTPYFTSVKNLRNRLSSLKWFVDVELNLNWLSLMDQGLKLDDWDLLTPLQMDGIEKQ